MKEQFTETQKLALVAQAANDFAQAMVAINVTMSEILPLFKGIVVDKVLNELAPFDENKTYVINSVNGKALSLKFGGMIGNEYMFHVLNPSPNDDSFFILSAHSAVERVKLKI